jgi:hypothetical protein
MTAVSTEFNLMERSMSSTIDLAELAILPHIDPAALQGRGVLLLPVWDGTSWSVWTTVNGRFQRIQVRDMVHASYFATDPAKEYDVHIPFLNFLWQQVSFPAVTRLISGIEADFHLMATIAAKLEHFHNTRDRVDQSLVSSFVRSELEHLIVVARSVFDLLQEIIATIWNESVIPLEDPSEMVPRRTKLKPTFSKIVLLDNATCSAAEISNRYALPLGISAMYEKHTPFFLLLRAWRDAIVHGGSSVDTIFATDKSFCVDPRSKHFLDFPWRPEHYFNESIVSLRPWLSHIVLNTVLACSEIMAALAKEVRFPAPIAPAHRIFLRDPSNQALVRLIEVQQGDLIWWEAKE